MNTQKLLAITASAVITLTGLVAMNSPVQVNPVSEINGLPVIDLAPVQVAPNAEDLRAAGMVDDAGLASAILVSGVGHDTQSSAALLGAQLAMPYYSFGTQFGRSSKE